MYVSMLNRLELAITKPLVIYVSPFYSTLHLCFQVGIASEDVPSRSAIFMYILVRFLCIDVHTHALTLIFKINTGIRSCIIR